MKISEETKKAIEAGDLFNTTEAAKAVDEAHKRQYANFMELVQDLCNKDRIHGMAAFQMELNKPPKPEWVFQEDQSLSIPIDIVEGLLDAYFLGNWKTQNFTTKLIGNELIGEIQLIVINPITGTEITRSGAGGRQIQVDKPPKELTGRERNTWYLDMQNKKPNALERITPALHTMCIKNAAKSLGNRFGRNLNRTKTMAGLSIIKREHIVKSLYESND